MITYYAKLIGLFIITVIVGTSGIIFVMNKVQNRDILGNGGSFMNRDGASELAVPSVYAKTGDKVPEFEFISHIGEKKNFTEFNGQKNTLIVFWATWCTWCAQERSNLEEFAKNNEQDINVILMDRGESRDVVASYADQNNISVPIGIDEDLRISRIFGATATPFHIYVNKSGKIVFVSPGYETPQDLEAHLQQTIASNK